MREYDDRRRSTLEEEERAFRDEYRGDGDADYERADVRSDPAYADERAAFDRDGPAARSLESHLFDRDVTDRFQRRWDEIQTAFVDEPRNAVQEADRLVGDVIDSLQDMFRTSRNELEQQWSTGREASTEDLRQALQRYRSFFHRLLTI